MTAARTILSILSGIPINFMSEIDKKRIVAYSNHNDMQYMHNINDVLGGNLIPRFIDDINETNLTFIRLATTLDKEMLVDVFNFAALYKDHVVEENLEDEIDPEPVKPESKKVMVDDMVMQVCDKLVTFYTHGNYDDSYCVQVTYDFHQDIADAFFEAYNYDFVAFRNRAKELEVWHPVMENANPARIKQL